ncbi:MAG: DUF6483 family protein [Clostridiales bacterium]|nr:DUF6483 family protein [Clostridiales bacterium]
MYEQDYIMRYIKEMVRALLKLLFHIDTASQMQERMDEKTLQIYEYLTGLIDKGDINTAENQLYELIDAGDPDGLKLALLFFDYLNEKSDDFLESNGFTRNEIRDDLDSIVSGYGYSGFVNALF